MKLVINKDRSVIPVGTWGTVNENNYEILDFEFPAELEEYNKRIVYYLGDERVWDTIVNNKAIITNAITTKEHVKAYVWLTKTDSQYETDVDFRTQLFEMNFYENENADGIVPTEEQVDGFNTMLTAMNAKIDEVDALEQTIETAEAQRQEAEATRVSNESTRESNESTRQTNEQTRQTQEAERERKTSEAIADIEDKTAEYNANAEAKTTAFNQNATQKTNEFNSNYTQKVNDFNTNASSKTSAFNSNAESKTSTFNTNATNKTNDFNSNATEKTTTFNDNASTKTSEFNSNAESKTSAFNDNATQKTTNFDNNASEKTDEFNTNAQEKIDEYDEHIVEYQAQIDELQEEVEELSENMLWNTTEQATEISVDDAAKYSRNKLELFGNTSQASTSIDDGDEYDSPSPDHPQPIHVVTGNNTIGVTGKNIFSGDTLIQVGGTGTKRNGFYVTTPGTYTVSYSNNNSFRYFSFRVIDNGVYGTYSSINSPYTFTINQNQTAIIYIGDENKTFSQQGFYNVQIEHGSTATSYEQYELEEYPLNLGSLELCKIGDYQDYLYKENGNWYKYGAINKVILDGTTETWGGVSTSNNFKRIDLKNTGLLNEGGSRKTHLFCSISRASTVEDYNIAFNYNNVIFFYLPQEITTGNEWIALLSQKLPKLYYILATPTTTQITDETLISQLDAIYEHLQLVKGTNNITVTASDLAPYMKLTYMQDLKSKLDNLDSRLSLLE